MGVKSNDEVKEESLSKYQKVNGYLSILFEIIIILFSFFIGFPIIIILSFPIFILLTLYEQKVDICPKGYSKYIYLINILGFLGYICFWLLPLLFPNILFTIPLFVFLLLFYLCMQIFAHNEYFDKKNVLIFQHILAVGMFITIIYSFFDIISLSYINFPAEVGVIIFANLLLHIIINLIILLISFYYLYGRYFRNFPWKNFNRAIITNMILIEITAYILINFKNFFTTNIQVFLNNIIFSLLVFPILFILFICLNYVIGVFPKDTILDYCYYSFWVILLVVASSIFYAFFGDFVILISNFLFISISIQVLSMLGVKIKKIKEKTHQKIKNYTAYSIWIEIFVLAFSLFFNVFEVLIPITISRVILSVYLAFLIITAFNIFVNKTGIIPISLRIITIDFALFYTTIIIFYFSFLFNYGTFFVYNVPALLSSLWFYLPLLRLKRRVSNQGLIKKIIKLNAVISSITLLVIPLIVHLDLQLPLTDFTLLNLLNFTLYIFYGILAGLHILSRRLNFRDATKALILKIQVLVEIFVTGTTVFYYTFILLSGTYLSFVLPLLFSSLFLFLPSFFSFKRGFFNDKLLKNIIIVNSIFLWGCIVSIPFMIGIDIFGIEVLISGIATNLIFVITISFFLGFIALKYFDNLFKYLKLKDIHIIRLKILEIFIWFLICALASYGLYNLFWFVSIEWQYVLALSGSFLLFFIIDLVNLRLLEDLKQTVFESEISKIDYYKIYKVYEFNKNFILYGILFSLSFLLTTFIQIIDIPTILSLESYQYFNLLFNFSFYFLFVLLLINLFEKLIKIEYERFKEILELFSWLCLKSLILIIFALYPFPILFFDRLLLIILIFSILSPITLYYIKTKYLIFEETQLIIKKLIALVFFLSFISLISIILLNNAEVWFFYLLGNELLFLYIPCKVILFSYFYFSRFNDSIEKGKEFRIYQLMVKSILFVGLFYLISMFLSPILSLIGIIIVLIKRARNYFTRFLSYLTICIIIYIEFISFLSNINLLTSLQVQLIFFISSVCLTFFLSIITNLRNINNLEHFLLYTFLSILSFLLTYSFIPILYDVTISLFIYLSLMGIFYYNKKDKRYKWFIKPCVLLAVFDFISFISFSVLFINAPFNVYNRILTFTLTIFVTGFVYVLLYNNSPKMFRKRSFYIVLTSNSLSLPIFIYFFLIAAFLLPLFDIIVFTIAVNVAIALFYISIAIYQWKISWAIWSIGYRIWILLPIANYLLISKAFTGIDVLTNAVDFFGFNIYGSNIIAFVICLLLSLPFWYTWIKKNFNTVLFIVWGLSLILIYWFSQNAFLHDIFLFYLSFFGIALIFLIPIVIRMKIWSWGSILWTSFSIIMPIFLYYFLNAIGLIIQLNISIILIVVGILFIILSFFPSLRAQKNIILLIAYIIAISGIFLIVFNILYLITYQFWISLFISLIIMSFSLYSSRVLKLNKNFFNTLISSTLIFSFTGITFFTFILIPNLELLSFYLALTVCGASFFVFNYYNLFIPAKRIIPLTILSVGLSLSASTIWSMIFPSSFFVMLAIFLAINLFFFKYALKNRRYILWYLSPIPITLLILEPLSFIELFQSLLLFIIMGLMTYTIIFQILINLSSKTTKERMQIKLVNLVCFLLISTYFSFLITVISPIILIYQIFEFLIIWSILVLFSTNYIKKSKITFDLENFEGNLNKFIAIVSISLYLEIFFLILGLLIIYSIFNINEILMISFSSLFLLTGFDLAILKNLNKKYSLPINYSTYLLISILLFIYLLQYVFATFEFLFLNLIIFLIMQYYSIYAIFSHLKKFNRYEITSLNIRRKGLLSLLTNSIFIIVGFYISSSLTSIIINLNLAFVGFPAGSFFVMVLSLFMFFLNNLLKYKSKHSTLCIFFVIFQCALSAFYLSILVIFNYFNFFSIFVLFFINTIMSFYIIYKIAKIYESRINKDTLHKIYSSLIIISYLEISLMFYGLANLIFGYIESFLISQLILFFITFMELSIVKRIRRKYVFILHTLSYFNVSISLFVFLLNFSVYNLSLLTFSVVLFCLMQFYTNICYYNTRKQFNLEKKESFLRWKLIRKNLIGGSFYITIIVYIWQVLFLAGYEILLLLFLLVILIHVLAIIDRILLKFIGRFSVHLMNYSWLFLVGFSVLYYSSWIIIFSFYVIPLIILLIIIELSYGYVFKLTDIWAAFKDNRRRFRNFLVISTYLNFMSWPFYFLSFEPMIIWGIIALSIGFGLMFTLIDKSIKAFNENFRVKLFKVFFSSFGIFFSIDVYFLLDRLTENNFLFNLSVSLFTFFIFLGILIKPFKRNRLFSFLYWSISFFLLSSISYNAYFTGISWAILIIGLLLYPFIFMLEELKIFFEKFVENISILFKRIVTSIGKLITGIFNFLKRNYKIIRVFLCVLFGAVAGILFSDIILHILNPYHSLLLGFAIFGLLYGILPSEKTADYDEIFKHKMTRFITLWVGMTAFIFLFILPYLESVLFSFFLLLLSILGLGAIILIYLYRLEEKQRISILWRFYTLITFFIILGIEVVIVVFLYLLE